MNRKRREIPDPGFAGDDGGADPEVTAALAAHDTDPAQRQLETLATLQGARVLVPVVAVLGEVEHDAAGRAHDKTSDMAAVLTTGRDGRQALLAFTSTGSLRRWSADARPVPVPFRRAAQAAVQQGAAAVVVDLAGPVCFVLDGDALGHTARDHRLVRVADGWAWAARTVAES